VALDDDRASYRYHLLLAGVALAANDHQAALNHLAAPSPET
jgi:hypothetical protein